MAIVDSCTRRTCIFFFLRVFSKASQKEKKIILNLNVFDLEKRNGCGVGASAYFRPSGNCLFDNRYNIRYIFCQAFKRLARFKIPRWFIYWTPIGIPNSIGSWAVIKLKYRRLIWREAPNMLYTAPPYPSTRSVDPSTLREIEDPFGAKRQSKIHLARSANRRSIWRESPNLF